MYFTQKMGCLWTTVCKFNVRFNQFFFLLSILIVKQKHFKIEFEEYFVYINKIPIKYLIT